MNRRVYEIAREQGVTSRELLDRLQAAGARVTTASSKVDDALALSVLENGAGESDPLARGAEHNGATAGGPSPEKPTAAKARPAWVPRVEALSNSVWLSFSATLLLVVVLAGAAGWALSEAFSSTPASFAASPPASRSSASSGSSHGGWSSVAVARYTDLTIYARPGAGHTMLTLSRPTPAQPLTLLVKQQTANWVQAYLPTRPNGLLGWVRKSSIRLFRDPWSVVIHLHSHRLVLRRANRLIRTFPIAVGKSSTPTPTGHFFINELLKQPDPAGAYGPYAFGTSDFSNVIKHFGNGGNGQIGIHGTDQPWVIGTSASHGCIRLYNSDITWLAGRIPIGTPVRISS